MPDPRLQPGLRDELITTELAEVLLETHRIDSKPLTDADAIERLGKHLLQVARRLRTPSGKHELGHSVEIVNQAIAALGDEFSGDQIHAPATVLKGIPPTSGVVQQLPPHPHIPLTTSELLVNGQGEPALGTILQEELRCTETVDLICAFVGFTGFQPLKQELQAVIERGGRVRVITSTYLGATSARALDELVKLGAEVRVNYEGYATKLHAKAWLFRRAGELDTAFVGSSNMSEAAFYSGLEWNVRLARADAPGVFARIHQTFEAYWNTKEFEVYTSDDRDRLDAALAAAKGYADRGRESRASKHIDKLEGELRAAYEQLRLQPRPHQQQVLDALALRRSEFDEHRHLIVAATGTGKTVMAAMDYARLCHPGQPRPRMLFIAHREQILDQAQKTFRAVLRDYDFGELLSGRGTTLTHGRHTFAMVQTLANRLAAIPPDSFDVIYVDEAHHGTADTWNKVISHFQPQELVGMTATPERVDGGSVADVFGGFFTTELRLWEAVDDQLLAPFHYVGVDDGTDLRNVQWRQGAYAIGSLETLYTGDHTRVRRIVESVHQWVEQPAEMRALGFCVSVAHAQFMAEQFRALGFAAEHLTGDHTVEERAAVLSRLQAGDLQAVFSVDILGEGVDVPDVNTLLLLRPTQSPVVFAQQLGRGLRLAPGKPHCLVLDFIGQHRAEYRLEERFRALTNPQNGDLRDQAEAYFPFLPAGCEIHLERVARERVLASLKAVRVGTGQGALVKDLKRLGSPDLPSFLAATNRSLEQFYGTDGRKMSWNRLQFAADQTPPDAVLPSPAEERLMRRMSYLQHVSDNERVSTWSKWLRGGQVPRAQEMTVAEQRLANQLMHLLKVDELVSAEAPTLQDGFDLIWESPATRSEAAQLLELTHAELDAQPVVMPGLFDVPLLAHARYTRAEVLAAIGVSDIAKPRHHLEGVYFAKATGIQVMFVTLHKDAKKFSSSTQYRDHALAPDLFHWESPNNWRQTGKALQTCIGEGAQPSKHRLLFVRETDKGPRDGTFRCFGQVDRFGPLEGDRPVGIVWKLRQPLPQAVFEETRLIATG